MGVALLLAALLAAPLQGSLGVRLEGSAARDAINDTTVQTGSISGVAAIDGSAGPFLLSGNWTPTFRYSNDQASSAGFLNTLGLRATLPDGRTTWSASVAGSAGQQDYSPLATAATTTTVPSVAPPPINRLPASRFLTAYSGTASLGVTQILAPRLTGGAVIALSTSGGLGADATAQIPRQQSASLATSLGWVQNRNDSYSLMLSGSYGQTAPVDGSAVVDTVVASLAVGWRTRIDPFTTAGVNVGAGLALNSGGTPSSPVLPAVSGSLARTLPGRGQALALALSATLAPAIDPLTGVGYLQTTGGANLSWRFSPELSFSGGVSGSRAVGGALSGQWGVVGEIAGAYSYAQGSALSLGFREAAVPAYSSATGAPGRGDLWQWTVFASVGAAVRSRL